MQKATRSPTITFEVVGGIVCACIFKPNHRLQLRGLAAQLGQLTVQARCYVPAPLNSNITEENLCDFFVFIHNFIKPIVR